MTIAKVQGPKNNYGIAPPQTLSVTLDSTPISGDVLICTTAIESGDSRTVSGISQTGVTWSYCKNKAVYNATWATYYDVEIWIGVVGSGASKTLTISYSGTQWAVFWATALEYSGVATSNELDKTASNTGTDKYPDTGTTVATAQDGELWIGATLIQGPNAQGTPTNGFTLYDYYDVGGSGDLGTLQLMNAAQGTAHSSTTATSANPWVGCIVTFLPAAGAISKSFSDVGGGSDAFLNPYRAMPFSETGHGVESFNTPFRSMDFADSGYGTDSFSKFITFLNQAFSDSGHGTDSFIIPFKELVFADGGHGTDAFLISFKGMIFSDVGHGTDTFTTPFRAMLFSESGHGADTFVIPFKALGFADVAGGTDSFLQEVLGAISKTFSEVATGVDSYTIPFKAIRFTDAGQGTDVFATPFRAMIFTDTGHGVDVFIIPFKALGFSDVGHGVDVFVLLRMLAFSDSGLGSDSFTILFKALTFMDVGSGADSFSKEILGLLLKAFSDAGLGSDAFNIPFRAMKFQDSGLGTDVWKGANLIEAPLVIVTADGKTILRISRATKKEPDYIMLG